MTKKVDKKAVLTSAAFAIVALAASAAVAAQQPGGANVYKTVFEQPMSNRTVKSAHFAVDREIGRAWIDVELTSNSKDDRGPEWSPPEVNVIRRSLEGLHYDRDRKEVVYGNGPSAVICAEDGSSPGSPLKTTGQCELKVSSDSEKVDDGFSEQEQAVSKVVFEVP